MSAVDERSWPADAPGHHRPIHAHRPPAGDLHAWYEELAGELNPQPFRDRGAASRSWPMPDDLAPTDVLPAINTWPPGHALTARQRDALLNLRQAAQEVVLAFGEHAHPD